MIASAVSTLARNLYTSNARFVFELLQNAEDNVFKDATDRGQIPYVAFRVHHDRIVVDCNEDGFTGDNLKAICDVGQSSKTKAQGYIGEKGIGFKSVFMVAWKVHIQSNGLSFLFIHGAEDTGLGMVTPIWKDATEQLPKHLTRMTLYLHEGNQELLSSLRDTIRKQFDDLQENLLLFMSKLKEIRITFFDENGEVESSTTFSSTIDDGPRVKLTRRVSKQGEESTTSKIYYIVRHIVGNLAKNENRTYSDYEEQTKTYARAEVRLGFPLSAESEPIVEPQDVFAFLPVRHAGFSFLIQSDFVTQANRQDIVITSRRNQGILQGIGEAFVQAVLEFCNHPTLQYAWVKYLPNYLGHSYDSFWKQLITIIRERLHTVPVLRPWSENGFRRIMELRYLQPYHLDSDKHPLFASENPEIYLSTKYKPKDIAMLEKYGMVSIRQDEVVSLVEKDLSAENSRIKSRGGDDDWQDRIATLLLKVLEPGGSTSLNQNKLRGLPLLPLTDGRWVSANMNGGVYFSKCAGLLIPKHLDLHLLHPVTEGASQRLLLVKRLGVCTASVDLVRSKIFARHQGSKKFDLHSIASWVKEIKFLYLTQNQVSGLKTGKEPLWLVNHEGSCCERFSELYLPDGHEFGIHQTLRVISSEDDVSNALDICFIHPLYLRNAPGKPNPSSLTWEDWLCTYLGLRRLVRLVTANVPMDLSEAVYYVAKHCPGKFLGFLRHHWSEGGKEIESSSVLQKKLSEIKVPCQSGEPFPLKETYLPIPNLLDQCIIFMRGDESLPFLELSNPTTSENLEQAWGFLTKFEVGYTENIQFYLDILFQISYSEPERLQDDGRVVNLYSYLYGKYAQSSSRLAEKKKIQRFFNDFLKIYLPPIDDDDKCAWVRPQDCVWNGPSCFIKKPPLKSAYDRYIKNSQVARSSVEWLFSDILKIPDATWSDIVNELQYREAKGIVDFDEAQDLYKSLHNMVGAGSENVHAVEKLRAVFKEKPLIFLPSDGNSGEGGWHRVSDCLWSSTTRIRGRAVLENHYGDLKTFFVNTLGVEILSLQLVYEELKLLGDSASPSVKQVQEKIFVLNSFLEKTDDYGKLKPKELHKKKVFPVRYPNGDIELCTIKTDFAIVNRTHLGEYFGSRIKTLSFEFDEIRKLDSFIRWVGLQDRFISGLVTETSRVDESGKRLVPIKDCYIRSKAHAICRIAFHYHSLRLERTSIQGLFDTLRNTHVYETNKISSELRISQDGKPVVHVLNTSELHIREENSVLEIFVPSNRRRREFCYASKLPSHLLIWLMSDGLTHIPGTMNEKAQRILASVLNNSRATATSILQEDGIASIEIEDVESEEEERSESEYDDIYDVESTSHVESDEERSLTAQSTARSSLSAYHSTPSTTVTQTPSLQSSVVEEVTSVSSRSHLTASQPRPGALVHLPADHRDISTSPRGAAQAEISNEDITIYRQLLDQVIAAARRANFPFKPKGSMDVSALRDALPTDTEEVFGYNGGEETICFRLRSQLERDKMVGAAGELYIFELLKALEPALPGFSIKNWQSTIRKYVKVHAEYENLKPWPGSREVADLMYDDTLGALTKLFIDYGYLDNSWSDCRPNYLLEVKATTTSCNTPFYMSKTQYKRMRDCRGSRQSVYVIFRVFKLYQDSIGLCVYVDPAEMEDKGKFVFTGETWSIVPGHSAD